MTASTRPSPPIPPGTPRGDGSPDVPGGEEIPTRDRRTRWSGVALGVVAVAAVLVLLVRGPLGAVGGSSTVPTSAALEARWGVRFTSVGMSADGGMVDVRYQVLDADRATAVAADVDSTPLIVEEGSGKTIFAVAMKSHAHELEVGGRYFLLYRNTDGLLGPGDEVSIRLGDEVLRHVPVSGTRER